MLIAVSQALAVEITLERPGDREFVRDNAGLITPEDKDKIVALCNELQTEKTIPIIVIAIDSMAAHGGDGMRIETFARLLFDQWEIGQAELNGQVWNTGILLLVSKVDRKARIELGAGWHRDKDQLCKDIMDQQIIPQFKQQDFSGGIKSGVIALDAMARELTLPVSLIASDTAPVQSYSPIQSQNPVQYPQYQHYAPYHQEPMPDWTPWAYLALAGLGIFTVVSLIRKGSGGWAWVFWGVVFTVLGTILYLIATSQNNSGRRSGSSWSGGSSSGGGSSGGGSSGGGFSGGGGASGSW